MGANPLFPMLIVLIFAGILALSKDFTSSAPPAQNLAISAFKNEAAAFLSYRNAVSNFAESNPGFIGSIPFVNLTGAATATQGLVNNVVTPAGGGGRLLIVHAALNPNAIEHAYTLSNRDAALGIASTESTWTSFNPGATAFFLPTSIPKGSLVSVIQLNN